MLERWQLLFSFSKMKGAGRGVVQSGKSLKGTKGTSHLAWGKGFWNLNRYQSDHSQYHKCFKEIFCETRGLKYNCSLPLHPLQHDKIVLRWQIEGPSIDAPFVSCDKASPTLTWSRESNSTPTFLTNKTTITKEWVRVLSRYIFKWECRELVLGFAVMILSILVTNPIEILCEFQAST